VTKAKEGTIVPFGFFPISEKGEIESLSGVTYSSSSSMDAVKGFAVHINNFLKVAHTYYPEPTSYLF
jgi:hypothetical protein